jgi:RimJ/RimL family protein N-acetyltransferase
LYLRLTHDDDAESVYRLVVANRKFLSTEQQWAREVDFMGLHRAVADTVAQIKANRWLQYRIMVVPGSGQEGVIVGTVTLFDRDVMARTARLSCWLVEAAHDKGYARRAIQRLCEYAYRHWGIDAIYTDVRCGNQRAERLMAHIGARPHSEAFQRPDDDSTCMVQTWELKK